jgi:hypothetical protein
MKEFKLKLINLIFILFIALEVAFFAFFAYKIGYFLNEISKNPQQGHFESYDFKKYDSLIKDFY